MVDLEKCRLANRRAITGKVHRPFCVSAVCRGQSLNLADWTSTDGNEIRM